MPAVPVNALPPAVPTAVLQMAETLIMTYLLDVALCGILSVQTYFYYLAFPNDRWINKTFVYATYVLGLFLTGLVVYQAFIMFGSGFADIIGATKVRAGWPLAPVIGGFVGLSTQSLYAYRIYILSNKSRIIPCIVLVASI
ncbi:hypothetical protein FB45DRAFT_1033156 [Roridomyces roridus]|uniref:Uncharacterized protein n=1 Tax=Roridomyces roridus TaxID=1738132 RepID=A0AAD7BFB1_9AGAR|nr:hypothetical protein FB45DRAFT_1033156 [Roridomyces roridus]